MAETTANPMAPGPIPALKEIVVPGQYRGYDYAELMTHFTAVHGAKFAARFTEWMRGQTGAIHEEDGVAIMVVYSWDVERFMRGKGPLD